jgi:hypothetical protein
LRATDFLNLFLLDAAETFLGGEMESFMTSSAARTLPKITDRYSKWKTFIVRVAATGRVV